MIVPRKDRSDDTAGVIHHLAYLVKVPGQVVVPRSRREEWLMAEDDDSVLRQTRVPQLFAKPDQLLPSDCAIVGHPSKARSFDARRPLARFRRIRGMNIRVVPRQQRCRSFPSPFPTSIADDGLCIGVQEHQAPPRAGLRAVIQWRRQIIGVKNRLRLLVATLTAVRLQQPLKVLTGVALEVDVLPNKLPAVKIVQLVVPNTSSPSAFLAPKSPLSQNISDVLKRPSRRLLAAGRRLAIQHVAQLHRHCHVLERVEVPHRLLQDRQRVAVAPDSRANEVRGVLRVRILYVGHDADPQRRAAGHLSRWRQ
mmetsp:Transcript_17314/g.65989  ORF Transcript_17314/g.65989 Transcript_17314/m.65989 type:complete len:309 (+) Transcript_17314:411-1337(+)